MKSPRQKRRRDKDCVVEEVDPVRWQLDPSSFKQQNRAKQNHSAGQKDELDGSLGPEFHGLDLIILRRSRRMW